MHCCDALEASSRQERPLFPVSGGVQNWQLSCTCAGGACNAQVCEHVRHLREDCAEGVEPRDWAGHPMGQRFPYDSRGRLILEARPRARGIDSSHSGKIPAGTRL